MLWNCLFKWKFNKFAWTKNSPKSSHYFGLLHSFKNHHNEPPKVAQLAKNRPIWSPCQTLIFFIPKYSLNGATDLYIFHNKIGHQHCITIYNDNKINFLPKCLFFKQKNVFLPADRFKLYFISPFLLINSQRCPPKICFSNA